MNYFFFLQTCHKSIHLKCIKKNWFWFFFLWAIFCKHNFFQIQKFKVPFPRLYKINISRYFSTVPKKKLKHKKNRVDPYPYPPPQSKVKVSRHGTATDKWPFRNSFTSQFPLESISNMLSIYRLPKSSGPPFFVVSSRSVPDCLLST